VTGLDIIIIITGHSFHMSRLAAVFRS